MRFAMELPSQKISMRDKIGLINVILKKTNFLASNNLETISTLGIIKKSKTYLKMILLAPCNSLAPYIISAILTLGLTFHLAWQISMTSVSFQGAFFQAVARYFNRGLFNSKPSYTAQVLRINTIYNIPC